MNKRDHVVDVFSRTELRIVAQYNELLLAIHNKRNEASLSNELAAQTALSLTVTWENFVNDLLLAYAEMNPTRAIHSLTGRILQSVESRYGKACVRHVICQFPRKPSARAIAAMIDDKGMNITARTAADLAIKANDLLSGSFAQRFTLDQRDAEFYDYVIAIRNYLGHMSRKSRQVLVDTTSRFQHKDNTHFQGSLLPIGSYLKVTTSLGLSRIAVIGQRLHELSQKM